MCIPTALLRRFLKSLCKISLYGVYFNPFMHNILKNVTFDHFTTLCMKGLSENLHLYLYGIQKSL